MLVPLPQAPPGAQGPPGPVGPGYGYANISDSQFTAAAPLAIMAVTPTPLTIDGLGSQSDSAQLRAPFAGWNFWSGNRFYPRGLHDGYVLRVSFTAMSLVIDNAIKLTMDIGGAIGTFYDDRRAFDTAAGEVRVFNFEISFFDAQTFVANGAAFLIDPLTAPVLLWGASIFVQPISVGSS